MITVFIFWTFADTCTNVSNTAETFQSVSDVEILDENILPLIRQKRSRTPNTPTPERSVTPNESTPEQSVILDAPTPKRQKKKQSLGIEEQLGDAVNIFKSFVTHSNTTNAEDESLKYFCDSLHGDLKNLSKKDLISCKIEIMQIISNYTK